MKRASGVILWLLFLVGVTDSLFAGDKQKNEVTTPVDFEQWAEPFVDTFCRNHGLRKSDCSFRKNRCQGRPRKNNEQEKKIYDDALRECIRALRKLSKYFSRSNAQDANLGVESIAAAIETFCIFLNSTVMVYPHAVVIAMEELRQVLLSNESDVSAGSSEPRVRRRRTGQSK